MIDAPSDSHGEQDEDGPCRLCRLASSSWIPGNIVPCNPNSFNAQIHRNFVARAHIVTSQGSALSQCFFVFVATRHWVLGA